MPQDNIIFAASYWRNNAQLIEDCVKLGYLDKSKSTLDPTYGRGKWWTNWQPDNFTYHDLKIDQVDFTNLPYEDNTFEQICFDPPYVCIGGRQSSGPNQKTMYEAFGLDVAPRTPDGVQDLIDRGLTECYRVLKPKSYILVKCQDYNYASKFRAGTYWTIHHAFSLGLTLKDRMEHLSYGRPQPERGPQRSARRNLSTLLIFRK